MTPAHPLADSLLVLGPSPELADELALFGQFIGSWSLTCTRESGELPGELHFGWVLGGRAVQDVWIVPGRDYRGEGQPPFAFHGSTLRFYDKALGAWRSTWKEPLNGRVRRFIGRADGDDIVLMSNDEEPRLRWSFTDIQPDSFTWRGENAVGDSDWALEETMRATRART